MQNITFAINSQSLAPARLLVNLCLGVLLCASLLLTSSARAQGQVIDVFDGQDKAKAGESGEDKKGATSGGSLVIESSGATGGSAGFTGGGGGFKLKFFRRGGVMMVPAQINGNQVFFIFDTGAAYVSVNPKVARKAGIYPGKGAPTTRLSTANGVTVGRWGTVQNLKLGGRNHDRVTFVLCNGCGAGSFRGKPIAGLLGMNVLGRYQTNIDEARGVVTLSPNINYSDRSADVKPWLKLGRGQSGYSKKGRKAIPSYTMPVKNLSRRRISGVRLSLVCQTKQGEKLFTSDSFTLSGKKTRKVTIPVDTRKPCREANWRVDSGRW